MPPLPPSRASRLAVLIDAENASARVIGPLWDEVARLGTASVKRIYGDWTRSSLGPWKDCLGRFAIHPVQQFAHAAGKNASDIALIIDAMDLLHSGTVEGFCLVSSDSDFTRLACRIRESGLAVYGFGERKTPEPFVRACDRFLYVEDLDPAGSDEGRPRSPKPAGLPPPRASAAERGKAIAAEPIGLIRSAYEALAPGGGWVTLSALGGQIRKLSPSFDARTFGFAKLSGLMSSLEIFRIEGRACGSQAGAKHLYVSLKK